MIVNVPNEDAQFYLDLMKWLNIEVQRTKDVRAFYLQREKIIIKNAFKQVELIKAGKLKTRSWEEVKLELEQPPNFVPMTLEVDEDFLDFMEILASKLIVLKGNEIQED